MQPSDSQLRQRLQTGFLGIVAFALLLFLLVQARFLLICLAIAAIIFSLTSDAISAFARLKVPSWLATTLALIAIAFGLLWAATAVVAQVNELVSSAILYSDRAQEVLARLTADFSPRAQETLSTFLGNFNVAGWMRSAAGQASNLISGAVLTVTFTAFMFAERVWFPIKLERILENPVRTGQVMDIILSITRRINRYLVVKSAISLVTAALIWTIFRAAGLDLAGPIAMLTFILNFIPSIGSIIATVIATGVVLAQTGEPGVTVLVGGLCATVQFTIGNVLDPLLLGQTLRLSSFGIILALAFWSAVWGIAGAFLAVPIMVACMIICAHIPWLRPIAIMLSHEGLPDAGENDENDDDDEGKQRAA